MSGRLRIFILAYNPVSGTATFPRKLDEVTALFQKHGIALLLYRTTKENAGFIDFVQASQAEGIIIAGGDGTVHEIVNLLMKAHVQLPVAILGSGTSNDFASYLGVTKSLEGYIQHIARGRTMTVDLGRVGEAYFINVASAGVFTSIAHEVAPRLKNSLGKAAYYLRGLAEVPKLRTANFHIEADDQTLEEEGFLFVIVNSGVVGSFNNVATYARLDDGKLDFLLVKKCGLPDLMALTAKLVAGGGVREQVVRYLQASSFRITADRPLTSDLDGEEGPPLPLEIKVVPRALKVFY